MKKTGLLTGMLFVVIFVSAQIKELSETLVESPRFNFEHSHNDDSNRSPVSYYLQESLNDGSSYSEGVVVILFTIKADGTLANFTIENSVSKTNDDAVIRSIQSTSGMWNPGLVNGNPVEMQRKFFVRFLNPENKSLEMLAQENINLAIRKYYQAIQTKENICLSAKKADKKADRKLNATLVLLEGANKYQPEEPSVFFWQACTYEQLGDEVMRSQKINEFINLIDQNYQAQIERIDINLK